MTDLYRFANVNKYAMSSCSPIQKKVDLVAEPIFICTVCVDSSPTGDLHAFQETYEN